MDIIRSPAPISLDGIHHQLHNIGLKINKATKTGLFSGNNNNNNNNHLSSASNSPSYVAGASASDLNNLNIANIDVSAIQSALSDSDVLLSQIRSACEDYSAAEPTVLQLEASVWIQRAKIEHISGRFRQSSSCYENACKCLLKVEASRAPIFSTQDALNHAITCLLYACGELVLSEHIIPSVPSYHSVSKLVASSSSSSSNSYVATGFLFGSSQEQQQAFSMFTTLGDAFTQKDGDNNNNNSGAGNNNSSSSNNNKDGNNNNKGSIGSRISSWFKGLPSIQPANSPAAAVAAEEQESLRKQREAEKLAKARKEATWRFLPLDAPHRFPASQRICSLLRFMARELLKYDSIELASHFADLSARYCLDYKFQFSFYSNLYQSEAMKRKLEIVAPAAPSAPSPAPRGFVPIPVSLCQLFSAASTTSTTDSIGNNNSTNDKSSSSSSSDSSCLPLSFSSPVVEFCSVSNLHPALRQQYLESMLQVCSTSLALRQFERARISGTFALFCLENNREDLFKYSVPNDHVNIAMYNMMSRSNFDFMANESFSASGAVRSNNGSFSNDNNNNNISPSSQQATTENNAPTSITSHFVTVATMNSNFSDEIKCDEDCAMIGLSIVLAVISSRPYPSFENICTSHIRWWDQTFVKPFFDNNNSDDENDDDEDNECQLSEFISWRKPVCEALYSFVDAVMQKRNGVTNNEGSHQENIFAATDKLKTELFERNQLLGLCAHRLFHEVFSEEKEKELVGSLVQLEKKQKTNNKPVAGATAVSSSSSAAETSTTSAGTNEVNSKSEGKVGNADEKRASSPKLDDFVEEKKK